MEKREVLLPSDITHRSSINALLKQEILRSYWKMVLPSKFRLESSPILLIDSQRETTLVLTHPIAGQRSKTNDSSHCHRYDCTTDCPPGILNAQHLGDPQSPICVKEAFRVGSETEKHLPTITRVSIFKQREGSNINTSHPKDSWGST